MVLPRIPAPPPRPRRGPRRVARRILALAVLLLVVASPPAHAATSGEAAPAPRLLVSGEPGTEGVVERLRGIAPQRFAGGLALAGLEEPGAPIRVSVVPEDTALARRTPSWIAGFADGDASSIVIFPARVGHYPHDSLEELLQHEVAHVYVDRAAAGAAVPRWLHEGIAMTAGDRWGLEDASRFAVEVALQGRVPLASLDRLFQGGDVRRAYAVAGGFVRHLLHRHGPGVTGDLLERLAAGDSLDGAFRRVTGEPFAAAEERFWRGQTFWKRWVPLLGSSSALWAGVALLALAAWKRRQARAAELMERWEAEETPVRPPRWSPHAPTGDDPDSHHPDSYDADEADPAPRDSRRRDWVH